MLYTNELIVQYPTANRICADMPAVPTLCRFATCILTSKHKRLSGTRLCSPQLKDRKIPGDT